MIAAIKKFLEPLDAGERALMLLGCALAIAVAGISLVMSKAIREQEITSFQNALAMESRQLAKRLDAELRHHMGVIDRMGLRWELEKGISQAIWTATTEHYITHAPGMQGIAYADVDGRVLWISPMSEVNAKAIGFNLNSEPTRRQALDKARLTRRVAITSPIRLVQDVEAILIMRALFEGDRHIGYFSAAYRFTEVIDGINREGNQLGYRVAMVHGRDHQKPIVNVSSTVSWIPLEIGDGSWGIELSIDPRQPHHQQLHSVSGLVRAAGLTIALLLLVMVMLHAVAQRSRNLNRINEARWRFAVEGSELGLWDWDASTNRVYFSPRWKQMLGYEEDEIGDHLEEWESRVHPDDIEMVREVLARHIKGETPIYETDHRMRCKDGSYKWVHDRGRVMTRDHDGSPLRILGTHTDITERRLLEQVQHDQALTTRLTLENQSIATFVIDHEHRVRQWNHACEVMTGIPAQDILGTTESWRGFYAAPRPCLADLVLDSMESEADQHYELNGPSSVLQGGWHAEGWFDQIGGKRRYLAFEAAPIRDPDGAISSVVETLYDLTDQKYGEELLRAGREIARQALISLKHQKYALDQHAIVAVTDIQGRITYANDKFCEISGYSREELIGSDHVIINSGVHPHGFFKQMYQTIARGKVWKAEICNRAKNGHLYWVETTVVPLIDEQGKPEQYISIRSDITERKLAEFALKASEEKFRSVFEHSNDALIFIKDGCFIDGNTRALEMFGLGSLDELRRLSPADISPQYQPDGSLSATAAAANIERASADGFLRFDWIHQRKDGTPLPSEVALYTFELHGESVLLAEVRDITERKAYEEELKKHRDHLQEMVEEQTTDLRASRDLAERANQAKSEFLANMSHELRTPLHAILSFSELGRDKTETASPEKLRGYFERVNASGNRLLTLLNDLLDLSKLEAGKMVMRIEQHDLLGILLQAVAEFDVMLQSKRIDLGFPQIHGHTVKPE